MRYLFFILFISILGCNSSSSQAPIKTNETSLPLSDSKEINNYITNFFDEYKKDGADKAIDYIFSINKTSSNGVDKLKSKLDSLKGLLGEFTGYKLITEKNVADGLVLRSYLVKHENHPVRFTIVFYKPRNNWTLYKFTFDVDIEDELEQSGKIYFIK